MSKITCDVIRDLLPLYSDHICTPDSCRLIEDHLKNCPDCRRLSEKFTAGSLPPEKEEFCDYSNHADKVKDKVIKDMAASWKKSIVRSFVKGLITAFCICLFLFSAYWGLSRWPLIAVRPDHIQTKCSVSGTRYTVSLKITDGYTATSADMLTEEDGKLFLILKRGVIPIKSGNGTVHAQTFSGSLTAKTPAGKTTEIKEIYCGTKEDHILLWKKPDTQQ